DDDDQTDPLIGGPQQLDYLTREFVSRENQDTLVSNNRPGMLGNAALGDFKPASMGLVGHSLKPNDGQRGRDTMIQKPRLTLPVLPGGEPVNRLTSDPAVYHRPSSKFNAF